MQTTPLLPLSSKSPQLRNETFFLVFSQLLSNSFRKLIPVGREKKK